MIKDVHGKKLTPKRMAQDILLDKISEALGYWQEQGHLTKGMTEREIELVKEQMKKQADRIARMFGYEEAWYS